MMLSISRRKGKSRRRLREAVISDETEIEETGTETETTDTGERGPGDEVASHIQVMAKTVPEVMMKSFIVSGSAPEVR